MQYEINEAYRNRNIICRVSGGHSARFYTYGSLGTRNPSCMQNELDGVYIFIGGGVRCARSTRFGEGSQLDVSITPI